MNEPFPRISFSFPANIFFQEIVDLVLDRIRKLADNCTGLQVENSFLMLALVEMVRMIMALKDRWLKVEFLVSGC